MSAIFDCPSCGWNEKEVVVPHDAFGYYISKHAVEAAECDLSLPAFKLREWLDGKHRDSGVTGDIKCPKIGRCSKCGAVASLDTYGNHRAPEPGVRDAIERAVAEARAELLAEVVHAVESEGRKWQANASVDAVIKRVKAIR